MLGICAGLMGTKSENVEKVLVFKTFFKGSREPRGFRENERPSEKRGFVVTLESLWGHFGVFGVTLGI